jgi:periplasmic divalent cation tolerance protein
MANENAEYCVIHITASSDEEARRIAAALVAEHLVACCSILPGVRSIYRWNGNVQEDEELLLMCKSRSELFSRIVTRVRELHSYEVPEIIRVPIDEGSTPYLKWIDESLSGRT